MALPVAALQVEVETGYKILEHLDVEIITRPARVLSEPPVFFDDDREETDFICSQRRKDVTGIGKELPSLDIREPRVLASSFPGLCGVQLPGTMLWIGEMLYKSSLEVIPNVAPLPLE